MEGVSKEGQVDQKRTPWWRKWWVVLLIVLIVLLIVLLCVRSCGCCCDKKVPAAPVEESIPVGVSAVEEAKPDTAAIQVEAKPVEEAFNLAKLRPVAWGVTENGYVESAAAFNESFDRLVAKAQEAKADRVEFPVAAIRYGLRGYDVSKVESEMVKALSEAFMKTSQEGKLLVEGYTCNVGNSAYNEKLSRQRAERVGNLLKDAGIPADKVEVKWYGETKYGQLPGVSGQEANRRVTITVE